MKAYMFLRTQSGTSKDVLNYIRTDLKQNLVWGNSVYGWYDLAVELEIPRVEKLDMIVDNLMHDQPDVIHINTMVERSSLQHTF